MKLRREETEILGYINHPYDALLDRYEPNLTTVDVDLIFDDVNKKFYGTNKYDYFSDKAYEFKDQSTFKKYRDKR